MKSIKTTLVIEQKQLNDQEILIKTSLIINSICFINMNIEKKVYEILVITLLDNLIQYWKEKNINCKIEWWKGKLGK